MISPIGYPQSSTVGSADYRANHHRAAQSDPDAKPLATDATAPAAPTPRAEQFNVDALVEQIWGFASARIASAQAKGASEADLESLWQSAEKGVNQGFGQARDYLDSQDALDDPLTLKINSAFGQIMDKLGARDLSAVTPNAPNATADPAPSGTSSAPQRVASLYQYERQTFALNLTTAQGDQILIRSVAEQSSTLEDQQFGRLSDTRWGSNQSNGFSLIIKGDLNERETADMDRLLAQVNELAAEFYDGDYDTAFKMAADLNIDGSSLKSLDMSMTEIEQKGVSVYSQTADMPGRLPKGLEPLRQYAEKLIAAQAQWAEKFNAPEEFLQTLQNHPTDRARLGQIAHHLLS
ncbi:DUF5610 domain-containing protein [Reinekea sp.]|jgi:hypothetical protein|uniref:DUF5610 domain-containing protein n=1 Tax=Reinekea sp. TaxID=1970455 RepID=UPI002A83580F|nr:DUF5610 domain-containing protein [Reinekea sp.]